MDAVAAYNGERWKRLVDANALFTRAKLDLTPEAAKQHLDQGALERRRCEGTVANVRLESKLGDDVSLDRRPGLVEP